MRRGDDEPVFARIVRPSATAQQKALARKRAWEKQARRQKHIWAKVEKGAKIIGPDPCIIYILDASTKLFQSERQRPSQFGEVVTAASQTPTIFELYRSSPGSARYTLNKPIFLLGRACENFIKDPLISECVDGYARKDRTSIKLFDVSPEVLSAPQWQFGGGRKSPKEIEEVMYMTLAVRFLPSGKGPGTSPVLEVKEVLAPSETRAHSVTHRKG
jgi:hypothetical protein